MRRRREERRPCWIAALADRRDRPPEVVLDLLIPAPNRRVGHGDIQRREDSRVLQQPTAVAAAALALAAKAVVAIRIVIAIVSASLDELQRDGIPQVPGRRGRPQPRAMRFDLSNGRSTIPYPSRPVWSCRTRQTVGGGFSGLNPGPVSRTATSTASSASALERTNSWRGAWPASAIVSTYR